MKQNNPDLDEQTIRNNTKNSGKPKRESKPKLKVKHKSNEVGVTSMLEFVTRSKRIVERDSEEIKEKLKVYHNTNVHENETETIRHMDDETGPNV